MNKLKLILTWLCQIGVAYILALAGLGKLQGSTQDIQLFAELGMEPNGRIIIGICELVAAMGLLHPLSAAYAALLGSGVLTGAGLAHLGPLGAQGIEIYIPTYLALLFIMIASWQELPFSAVRSRH